MFRIDKFKLKRILKVGTGGVIKADKLVIVAFLGAGVKRLRLVKIYLFGAVRFFVIGP